MKNTIKPMAMEQSLYAQVVKLRRKYLKFVATDQNKNEAKFKFQGQYARSQIWFNLDLDWIEINLSLVNLIYIRNFFKAMTIHKTIIHSKLFKFQLEKQNV